MTTLRLTIGPTVWYQFLTEGSCRADVSTSCKFNFVPLGWLILLLTMALSWSRWISLFFFVSCIMREAKGNYRLTDFEVAQEFDIYWISAQTSLDLQDSDYSTFPNLFCFLGNNILVADVFFDDNKNLKGPMISMIDAFINVILKVFLQFMPRIGGSNWDSDRHHQFLTFWRLSYTNILL